MKKIKDRSRAGIAKRRYKQIAEEWTTREMRLVELHYGRMTRRQLVAHHLPQRTIKAVERMARLLDVSRRRPPVKWWRKKDLALLREVYGTMENAELCRLYFPDVSPRALGHRAVRLGLRSKEPEWTAAEDRLVRRHYGLMSNRELAARHLQRRTPVAVEARGSKLGLSGRAEHSWTAAELRRLARYYAQLPVRKVVRLFPGRTAAAIRTRIRLEGLQKRDLPPRWQAREHALIRRYYESKGGVQRLLRELPGRTKLAIQQQARKLGMSLAADAWSAKDEALLRRQFPRQGYGTRIPGRTRDAVRGRIQKLRLMSRPLPPPGSRRGQKWSRRELDILRAGRKLPIRALAAQLPGRSDSSIKGKRSAMGVPRQADTGAGSPWAQRELSVLRRHPRADARELLPLLPGRTYGSVRTRLRHLRQGAS